MHPLGCSVLMRWRQSCIVPWSTCPLPPSCLSLSNPRVGKTRQWILFKIVSIQIILICNFSDCELILPVPHIFLFQNSFRNFTDSDKELSCQMNHFTTFLLPKDISILYCTKTKMTIIDITWTITLFIENDSSFLLPKICYKHSHRYS